MGYWLKKSLGTLLTLWLTMGSICSVLAVSAPTAATGTHQQHVMALLHTGGEALSPCCPGRDIPTEPPLCCRDGHGRSAIMTAEPMPMPRHGVVALAVPTWREITPPQDAETLCQAQWRRCSLSPPDATSRRESERDSTQLLL
ncbi:hypothetical protein H6771_00395 [Candidatus Peribacteria bacterium]|nr:hypothetical protein [Candidatus Peribacteria bacterium]